MGKMNKREKIIQSIKSIAVFTMLILVYWFAIGRLIEGNGGLFIVGFFVFLLITNLAYIWFRFGKLGYTFENPWPEYMEKSTWDKTQLIVMGLLLILISILTGFIALGSYFRINNIFVEETILLALIAVIIFLTLFSGFKILYNFFFKNIPFVPMGWLSKIWRSMILNKPMQYFFIGLIIFVLSALIYLIIMFLIVMVF